MYGLRCAQRKQRGYLTIEEEEEDSLLEQQQQQQLVRPSRRAATAAPGRARFPSNRDTTREATTPRGTGRKGANFETPSPSSRRPVTVAARPREVVVGRDLSLGRQPESPLRIATGTPDAGDRASGDHAAAAGAKGRGGFRGSKAITVSTRGGGEVVVVVPKRPRPIWFAGSGAVQAEWSALPGGSRVVRDLEGLEEKGRRVTRSDGLNHEHK